MHEHSIMILAAVNLGMEAVHKVVEALMPIFSALVLLGQIAVAVVTVVYIVQKIHLLKKDHEKRNRDTGD